jgi:hypothetical protein
MLTSAKYSTRSNVDKGSGFGFGNGKKITSA